MSELSRDAVLDALKSVVDPIFEKPMLDIETLCDVEVKGRFVRARVRLASPSERLQEEVRARVGRALAPLEASAELAFEAQVPTREVMGDDPIPGVKNVILVMSGKGGVGKSTTAVNLTLALKQLGLRVGLLDADIYGPSIPTMMGVNGHPVSKDGKRMLPLERFGVSMMSIGFLLEDEKQAVVWRGPMLHGALSQFLTDVEWGELDYLVLDLPPGTGDVALTLSQNVRAAGAVLVTTPQDVALADVVRAKQMFDKVQIPVLGIVENMSQFVCPHCQKQTAIFHHGGGRKASEAFGVPFLGEIPLELKVREGGDAGVPIVAGHPDSPEAQAFMEMAKNIAGRISTVNMASVKLPVMA